MKTFHNPHHALHQGREEMFRGRMVPCHEVPARLDYVMAELQRRSQGGLFLPEVNDADLDAAIGRVHHAPCAVPPFTGQVQLTVFFRKRHAQTLQPTDGVGRAGHRGAGGAPPTARPAGRHQPARGAQQGCAPGGTGKPWLLLLQQLPRPHRLCSSAGSSERPLIGAMPCGSSGVTLAIASSVGAMSLTKAGASMRP